MVSNTGDSAVNRINRDACIITPHAPTPPTNRQSNQSGCTMHNPTRPHPPHKETQPSIESIGMHA